MVRSNKLLLVLASTVVLGFGTHDHIFVLSRLLRVLKWGLFSTTGGVWLLLITPRLLGSDCAGCHSSESHVFLWLFTEPKVEHRVHKSSPLDPQPDKSNLHLFIWTSPLWDADSHLSGQEIPCILWDSSAHYRVHKSSPLAPALSRMNPAETKLTPSIRYNVNVKLSLLLIN
jgi:hypothetical protein